MTRVLDVALAAGGVVGWLCAGPLAATLLVGRSALFFPSLRWLLTALGAWLLTAGLAVLLGATGRRGPGSAGQAALGALPTLLPLLAGAPLLPLLYLDDASYHLVAGGESPPARGIATYLLLLLAGGALASRLVRRAGGAPTSPAPGRSSDREAHPAHPAVLAAGGGVAGMLFVNRVVLAPLAQRDLPSWWLVAQLLALAVTLAVAAAGPRGTRLARLVTGIALLAAFVQLPATGAPPLTAADWLWGTAHATNLALSGLHLRLFLGPGYLTAPEPPPHLRPALALTLGALLAGGLAVARLLSAGGAGRRALPLALALTLTALLLLAPTTPHPLALVALVACLPYLSAAPWEPLSGPARLAAGALLVAGCCLAGTGLLLFLRSAAQLLSAAPTLASLPTLGLALLTLCHAVALRGAAGGTTPLGEATRSP